VRILVADDHQLFLDGIRHILKQLDLHVDIVESTRASQAIEILDSGQEFDLILVDLNMPGLDGMTVLQFMHNRQVWSPLVVISAEEDPQTIKSALNAGALGFIPKAHSSRQMLTALQEILEGNIYIPPEILHSIENLQQRETAQVDANHNRLMQFGITRRHNEVLQLLAKGYTNKQIAVDLYLTEHTVKAHVSALFTALDARNRTECVQLARQNGMLVN
jgi:DNA-binding NarL/FixJ family response regulator